jgi:hypothetical protein
MAVADTSCSVHPEGGKGDDVLETVARIGSKLASEEGGETVVVESLRELQGVHITFEALEATKIGRAVNALRKSAPSEEARQLAAALYKGWKALANERFRSSRAPPQQPGIEKGPSTPPPPPVKAKQSARPEDELETIAPTSVVVEAAPEAKLHLHEGFDSAATILRKPKSLRLINTNAPGKTEHRRVMVVRRTAAAPAPAPASNTARRNGGGPNSNNQQACCPATASHQGTNAATKRVSPTGTAPLTTANKPPTALPKPIGSSGACKRKAETPAVFDEARLARARIRLHEGYKEASAVKEKRKIKEINVIDALGKKARQRTACHVRGARLPTGKGSKAPVPCPPRMPRAF